MSKNLNELYTWSGKQEKQAVGHINSGELLTEQKAENTISEMVESMILSGKMLDLAKVRAGNTEQTLSESEAFERAMKLPDLMEIGDIQKAKNKLENMYQKLEQEKENEIERVRIAEALKELTPETV